MNFEEHAGKSLVLAPAGIAVLKGRLCRTAAEARAAAEELGACVVKAQVPTGKRGKAGGIRLASTPEEAEAAAKAILGMRIGEHTVERLLVEEQAPIARELYAAVLPDAKARKPLILFSTEGGMDIEEVAATKPDAIRRMTVEIDAELKPGDMTPLVAGTGLGASEAAVAGVLARLYTAYRKSDAELLEINPLAILKDGRVVALDCKFVLDDSSASGSRRWPRQGAPRSRYRTRGEGACQRLKFIQLDGNVGVLANGAGLTMTTMDRHPPFRWPPANFLEIGGGAYQGETARSRAFQSRREEPGGQLLRRFRPHGCHG